MAGEQTRDLRLHAVRQVFVGPDHVGPDGVATDRRAFQATQDSAERRLFAPGRIAMPGILVMVGRRIPVLVDADEARMIRITAGHRMVLERAEALREGYVIGFAHLLVAEEKHLVLQQRLPDVSEQVIVGHRFREVDPAEFGADVRGELLDTHQITKMDEPVVFPASMSLCAWTASSSSYRWLISILMRPLATWSNRAVASSARSAGSA